MSVGQKAMKAFPKDDHLPIESKGGPMRKKALAMLGIPLALALALGNSWADISTPFTPGKVGDEAFSFVLPSSQGKLVDYYKDYYGKYHLVMTFFPAAFTPV
jgi:hypothetical protein